MLTNLHFDNCWVHGSSIFTSVVIVLSLLLVVSTMPKLGAFKVRVVGALATPVFGVSLGMLQAPELLSAAVLDTVQCAFWFGLIVLLGMVYLLIGPGYNETVK